MKPVWTFFAKPTKVSLVSRSFKKVTPGRKGHVSELRHILLLVWSDVRLLLPSTVADPGFPVGGAWTS